MTERRTGGTVSTPDDRWANLEELGRATRGRGPRKRMSPGRRRRLTWTIAVTLSVVVVMAAAGALVGYRYADRLVGKGHRRVANLAPVASGAPVNILLVGSDSRDGLSKPAGAATFRFEPASEDGYYSADTEVTVIAEPKDGYRFRYWDGDLYGASATGKVWMGQTRRVVAVLERATSYGPAAVRNSAGETPEELVAPGSIITVYGRNLAPYLEQGPASPLAQTIAGITVLVGDRMLPLVFVSPDRIDAQLPSDLPEGGYKLVVNFDDLAEIPAPIKVARNAPGLYNEMVEEKPFARALHEDGTPVTRESPARRGEIVTLLGTGFGPYRTGAIDGFPVPEGMTMELEDAVEIRAGGVTLKPESAVAAVGRVGTTAIRIKIADPLPVDTIAEVIAVVNGRESNKVLLPLK